MNATISASSEILPPTSDTGDEGETPCAGAAALPIVRLPHDMPVFLVGMMGAGKTTIGRGLARALGRPFIDLDHETHHGRQVVVFIAGGKTVQRLLARASRVELPMRERQFR